VLEALHRWEILHRRNYGSRLSKNRGGIFDSVC